MESQKRSWKLQEFVAHKANVNCLAMGHKSNQVLATGGDDKKVNLWAIGRENCLMSLSGHTTPVECVCFGHSEDLVCAGSQTGTLKIWDLEAAKLLRTLTGHKGAIKCMDFHPYGDYLTTGSCDSSIKLWDTRKKGCIVTYPGHRLAVNSLQFSPDGQWIASACEEGILKVWDVRVGKVLHEFVEHTSAVTCVKFHPHEFLLASSGADYTVNFWDMEKFQLVSKFEKQGTCMRSMMFSEDGSTLLGSANNGLYVVGWEPTRLLDTVQLHWGHIQDMTIAQTQLIAGSFHSTYVVVSVVDLNKVYPFGGPPVDMKVEETSPFQKGHSVRKSFSKEKPSKQVIHKSTVLDDKTAEESTSGTEADDENGAVIPNITDYTEIFRPSRALTRTPPPLSPTLSTRTYDIAESEVDKNDSRNCLAKLKCVKQGTPCMCANKARSLIKGRTRSNEVCKKCTFKNDVLGNGSKDESVPSASNSSVRRERKEESIPLSANVVKRERNTKEEPIPVTITTGKKEKSSKEEAAQATPITTTANATTAMSRDLLPSMPIATLPAVTLPPMPASKPSTPPPPRTTSNRDVSARSPLNRHNSYKETKHSDNITAPAGIKQSSSDISLGPTSVGQRSLSFTRTTTDLTRRRVEPARDDLIDQSPEPEFIPFATDRPVGLDLDEFLPRNTVLPGGSRSAVPAPSEQEVLGVMMRGHDSMMCVLTARQRALQIFHSVRINKSLKSALESVIALEDQSVILDILNIMAHKPSLWNLDICLLMLPKISELLQSKYESYMQCGCNALRLVVRNFSSVVRANVSAPVRTLGVDIPREERYAKCVQIHRQLIDLRAFLLKRQTLQGRLGAAFRDLHNLMQQGLD